MSCTPTPLPLSLQLFFDSLVFLYTLGQGCGLVSKHRALVFYFSVRIWYMFSISKCREEPDLGLCMNLLFAKRMPLRSVDFRLKSVLGRRIRRKLALRSGVFFASTELMHRPGSDSSLPFDIKNIYQIRNGKINC